jgi:hypothetical protein
LVRRVDAFVAVAAGPPLVRLAVIHTHLIFDIMKYGSVYASLLAISLELITVVVITATQPLRGAESLSNVPSLALVTEVVCTACQQTFHSSHP